MPATVLRSGSRGPAVTELQGKLNRELKPVPPLPMDGIFGAQTEKLVSAFQKLSLLPADGIVELKTWRAFDRAPAAEPSFDGEVTKYQAEPQYATTPRIYYVNGIQTTGKEHGLIVRELSVLAEHRVIGIYNRSGGVGKWYGFVADLTQCLNDWSSNFGHKIAEKTNQIMNDAINGAVDLVRKQFGKGPSGDPVNVAGALRRTMPESARVWLVEKRLETYNPATASLFRQLRKHRDERQLLVAHSQGNLIVCDALWALALAYGEESMARMQVYSMASPSPAWPMGIRLKRKVYGHTNDAVTLADPHNWTGITNRILGSDYGRTAGDWRKYGGDSVGIKPHAIRLNIFDLNFANRIRRDMSLPPIAGSPEPPGK